MDLAVTLKATELNPNVGDLALNEAGDFYLHTTLAAEVAQRLTVRLNFFRGEWFLDLEEGTPYFQQILGKGASDRTIRSIFGQVITGCPGVAGLISFSYSVGRDRRLTLRFRARLDDQTVFVSDEYGPFVVNL